VANPNFAKQNNLPPTLIVLPRNKKGGKTKNAFPSSRQKKFYIKKRILKK
jgi:hypothetical protein